ncbi:MAG: 50S ribosomal protein L18 [Fimbriimonadaceae bacterium]
MATKSDKREARHKRIRKKIFGTAERPRVAVFRSLNHISAQIIDDTTGKTLASVSTMEKAVDAKANVEGAKMVGALLGARAKEKGISQVVFDRGGFRYHGRIASFADGLREAGVKF